MPNAGNIPMQPSLLTEVLAANARSLGQKAAVVCDGVTLSYADLDRRSNQIANRLVSRGLAKGDSVALLSRNRAEHIEVMFGIMKAGGIVAPLSKMLNNDTLLLLLKDSGASFLFTEGESVSDLQMPGLEVFDLDDQALFADVSITSNITSSATLSVGLQGGDLCSLIYSSGTTGLPKGIMHSHGARAMYGTGFAAEYGINAASRVLLTTPAYSNGSWMMMLPTLTMGATLVIKDGFDVDDVLATLADQAITHTFLVPTQIESLLKKLAASTANNNNRHCESTSVISAGSALREATKRAVLERLTPHLFELYGNTEGVATILRPWQLEHKLATVGSPISGGEICILSDDGELLPIGQRGEVAGRSAYLCCGYHNLPEANQALFWFDENKRPFVKTGDIGVLDDEGFLTILDRKKDMIVSGGINVFASDLEAVIAEHAEVSEVAVIAVPHAKWGETPLALIVREAGAGITETALADWANQRLNKHQRLQAVEFRPTLPRNALGKVMKKSLRAPYWNKENAT